MKPAIIRSPISAVFIAILLLGSTLFVSCNKDKENTNWNSDFLLPLAYSSLSTGNLIPDSLWTSDENETVFLSFSDTIFKLSLDTLIQIPDTSLIESFEIPFGGFTVPPGTEITNIQEEINIESNEIELRNAIIESGQVIINLSSTFEGPVICSYKIPDATLNGVPLEISAALPAGSISSPASVQISIDASGYFLDFSNGNDIFNSLPTELSVISDPNSEPLMITFGSGFELTTTFDGLTPSFAEGYFGQAMINTGAETQAVNAFDLIENGTIDLDQVYINLKVVNGFGVDIRARFEMFNAINNNTASNVGLNHSIIGSPINLNRATHNSNSGVINFSEYNIALNHINSDIDQMLEIFPNLIEIEADLELNPLGNISNHHDFAYSKSILAGILDVDIPLCLIAENLQLADTSDFSLGEEEGFQNINSGTLILQIDNGFPLEGWLSIKGLNSEGTSRILLEDGYFSSGLTNVLNEVTGPVYSEIHIALSKEDINWLNTADRLIIGARFNTSSLTEHVKILSHYNIDIKVIADFNYNVNG